MSEKRPIWKCCNYCVREIYHPEVSSLRTCSISDCVTGGTIFIRKKTWDQCDEFKPRRVCETCEKYYECLKDNFILADKIVNNTIYHTCDAWKPNKDIDDMIKSS